MTTEEVIILMHENALDAMLDREARLMRQMRRLHEDIGQLRAEIDAKQAKIAAARENYLRGCV